MKSLFFGGIHPADRKELSASAELKLVNHPKQVSILSILYTTISARPRIEHY